MGKIIFIGNYKGGVGKTTTVINLANYFSEEYGKKVLTIDLDPQSSLSEIQVNNYSQKPLIDIPDNETLNYIFDLSIMKIKHYPSLRLDFSSDNIIKDRNNNYSYILSSLFYRDGEKGLDTLAIEMKDDIQYLSILKNYIDTIKNKFDFILIDCPPSNNLITRSAFLLSDFYIIPTVLDGLSTNGVIHYIRTIKNTYKNYCEDSSKGILAKHYFGQEPKLLGIFYNMIRAQVNYHQDDKDFKTALSGANIDNNIVFNTNINNYIAIARATAQGRISNEYAKDDFKELSKLILDRINKL
mgnify:CR=1 FL=1